MISGGVFSTGSLKDTGAGATKSSTLCTQIPFHPEMDCLVLSVMYSSVPRRSTAMGRKELPQTPGWGTGFHPWGPSHPYGPMPVVSPTLTQI